VRRIAQPSLTKSIRTLETELGGRLFCRKPTIELSELGGAVRPYLRRIALPDDNARQTAHLLIEARREAAAPESSPGLNGDAS
jgi:DNA-binding transcriptional LysR family regulator